MARSGQEPYKPCASKEVRKALGETCQGCENPSLLLHAFARLDKEGRWEHLRAVCACHAHHAEEVELPAPKGAIRLFARLKSRLLVNLAGGVIENANIALHPHFGVPYLPGSAVKGIARHAAWCAWVKAGRDVESAKRLAQVFGFPTGDFNKDDLNDQKTLDGFLRQHGEVEHAGCVAFLPAFPIGKGQLEVDVGASHHSEYYKKARTVATKARTVATDDESVIPLFFPAVAAGTEFRFTLVPLRGCQDEQLKWARQWLIEALTQNGAGAKTAAGYGWFEDVTQEVEERVRQEKEDARLREEWKTARTALREEIAALPTSGETVEAVRALLDRVNVLEAQCDAFQHIEEMRLCLQEKRRALEARLAELTKASPIEVLRKRWTTEKAILADLRQFHKLKEGERKTEMVALLCHKETLAGKLFSKIKGNQIRQRDLPEKAKQAILAAVKAWRGGTP